MDHTLFSSLVNDGLGGIQFVHSNFIRFLVNSQLHLLGDFFNSGFGRLVAQAPNFVLASALDSRFMIRQLTLPLSIQLNFSKLEPN